MQEPSTNPLVDPELAGQRHQEHHLGSRISRIQLDHDDQETAVSVPWARYKAGRELAKDFRRRAVASTPVSPGDRPRFLLNHPADTVYQNSGNLSSDKVVTMFTQQWVGIRQACGALPGHKLALDGHHSFEAFEIGEIASRLRDLKIEQVVYHGMANSTATVIRGLKILLPAVKFYGAWHGTMAGWSSPDEIKFLKEFLDLANDRIYERIGFLRQGMQRIHPKAFAQILYNMPPNVNIERLQIPFASRPIKCIFPSWNNVWKNMYTNVLATHIAPIVGDVFLYSQPQIDIFDKVRVVAFGDHETHYQRVARMDLCLNVSINDCQPMSELEGLSVGTPSLRNDWNLDLEVDSSYENVFTVKSYLNATAIAEKICEIGELDPEYISALITEHRSILVDASRARYKEFLSNN